MKIMEDCKILKHEKISPEYYLCMLKTQHISAHSKPGNFIHVNLGASAGILLRRPFSLLGAGNDSVSFVYKVTGKGTEILSKKKAGSFLNIVGPLGNSYDVDKKAEMIFLAAGGYGVSPAYFLARSLLKEKFKGKIVSVIGARTRTLLMYEKQFKQLGVETHVTTDDGSQSQKGIVTDGLKEMLKGTKAQRHKGTEAQRHRGTKAQRHKGTEAQRHKGTEENEIQVFCCGPYGMLKSVAKLCAVFSVDCQVSMEQQMGCGIGACLGCVIKTTRGYERVCTEGPVFDAKDIIWE